MFVVVIEWPWRSSSLYSPWQCPVTAKKHLRKQLLLLILVWVIVDLGVGVANSRSGRAGCIRYSCRWLRGSSPTQWLFEPVVGKKHRTSVKFRLPQFTFQGSPGYSFIDEHEREDEYQGGLCVDCPSRDSNSDMAQRANPFTKAEGVTGIEAFWVNLCSLIFLTEIFCVHSAATR